MDEYLKQESLWCKRKETHKQNEIIKQNEFPERLRKDVVLMDETLQDSINSLAWPRETLVSYEINNIGKSVWLDVDLPEIEDLPQKVASIAASGKKLNIKSKSQKQLREEYALHVHGIVFRLVGIVFATLPTSDLVIISGYSQRLDKSTGKIN